MRNGRLALDSHLDAVGCNPRLMVTLDRTPAEAEPKLGGIPGVTGVTLVADDGERRCFALQTLDPRAAAPAVARAVTEMGWDLYVLEPERRDLEALFRAISGSDSGLEEMDEPAADPSGRTREAAHV